MTSVGAILAEQISRRWTLAYSFAWAGLSCSLQPVAATRGAGAVGLYRAGQGFAMVNNYLFK